MIAQVKLFNEFVKRFNYEKTFENKDIDSAFNEQIKRPTYLKLLFNELDERLKSNDNLLTPYSQLQEKFIAEVCDSVKAQFINKYSEDIFAIADCELLYHGKPKKARLTFQKKVHANKTMEWKIIHVKADFLEIPKSKSKHIAYIPPNSNETNFMSLLKIFEQPKFEDVFEFDKENTLAIFAYEIYKKHLKFKHLSKIKYEITAIKNWKITVEEFKRKNLNSGWLISNIEKVK